MTTVGASPESAGAGTLFNAGPSPNGGTRATGRAWAHPLGLAQEGDRQPGQGGRVPGKNAGKFLLGLPLPQAKVALAQGTPAPSQLSQCAQPLGTVGHPLGRGPKTLGLGYDPRKVGP